jgi:hypothetical protein
LTTEALGVLALHSIDIDMRLVSLSVDLVELCYSGSMINCLASLASSPTPQVSLRPGFPEFQGKATPTNEKLKINYCLKRRAAQESAGPSANIRNVECHLLMRRPQMTR